NFVENIGQATAEVQRRMVWHCFMAEDELGQRVGDGLGISADDVRDLPPLPTQQLSEAEQQRLENLGKNGPRDVTGKTMTHCVPNKHVVVAT
ncbi:MAG: catalase, partial [Actinomycetota bacterium]|nr:catalase [Actinomycetota bacterium]